MTTPFKAAAILGWPAKHSRSPLLHGYWLKQNGLTGAYVRVDLPRERFTDFVRDLPAQGLVGANVTVPHKEAAFAACAELDEAAAALGAVNVLAVVDGRLTGANTDMAGFLADLDQRAPGWDRARGAALVLGAGGAARAVVLGLVRRGFARIVLANRTLDRAEGLAARFGGAVVPVDLADAQAHVASAEIIVNTTSLGMKGEGVLPVDFAAARPEAVVYDAVYVPLETAFLAAARERRLHAVDGLGMLLHQAVPAFARWFGVTPIVTPELRALVEADLGL
jgi:shikimate dehydrogenase